MKQYNDGSAYEDEDNINLAVTLKTGETYQLRCYKLRTYSQEWKPYDAQAVILYYEINGLIINGSRVEPSEYSFFTTPDGRKWKIKGFSDTSPLEIEPGVIFNPGGLIFNLDIS